MPLPNPTAAGQQPPPQGPALRSRRLRIKLNVTLHPDTVDRLDVLCDRYKLARGAIIDRVVYALAQEHETGTCHCAHGTKCPTGHRDIPAIL